MNKIIFAALLMMAIGCAHKPKTESIDRSEVRAVIRKNLKIFEVCYNQALKRNENAGGKIVISWEIIEKGAVKNAKVANSTLNDKEFDGCMIAAMSSLTFPEQPKNQIAEVIYPFVFASSEDGLRTHMKNDKIEYKKNSPQPPNEETKQLLKEKPGLKK